MVKTLARKVLPKPVFRRFRRWKRNAAVVHRSRASNVYHCCVPRTASQWLRGILQDERVFVHSGLRYEYSGDWIVHPGASDPVKLTEGRVREPLPPRTIATFYLGYEGFASIPKPARYRAFFVARDPRDLVVSWYFSMRNSHELLSDYLARLRTRLREMPRREGLRHAMEQMAEAKAIFPALRSWIDAEERDPNVRVVRFEDLTGPGRVGVFQDLFAHCDIGLSDDDLERLLEDHSFSRLSGRRPGKEDRHAHMRKGVAGDWRNHLDAELLEEFRCHTGDLVERLGYS